MTDERLRRLERRWKETDSIEDGAAYIIESTRQGCRDSDDVRRYCARVWQQDPVRAADVMDELGVRKWFVAQLKRNFAGFDKRHHFPVEMVAEYLCHQCCERREDGFIDVTSVNALLPSHLHSVRCNAILSVPSPGSSTLMQIVCDWQDRRGSFSEAEIGSDFEYRQIPPEYPFPNFYLRMGETEMHVMFS